MCTRTRGVFHLSRRSPLASASGLVVGLALFVSLSGGCEDKRRHLAGEGVKFVSVDPPLSADAPPEAVAMAALDALRDAQVSRAGGLGAPENRQRYEQAMETLRSLASADEIYHNVRTSNSGSIPKDITRDAALTLTVESWVSMVAHYVNGYRLDTRATAIMVPNQQVEVYVNAENARDDEVMARLTAGTTPSTAPAGSAVRAEALAQGVCPPAGAAIVVRLAHLNGSWRVQKISLGPQRQARTAGASSGVSGASGS